MLTKKDENTQPCHSMSIINNSPKRIKYDLEVVKSNEEERYFKIGQTTFWRHSNQMQQIQRYMSNIYMYLALILGTIKGSKLLH